MIKVTIEDVVGDTVKPTAICGKYERNHAFVIQIFVAVLSNASSPPKQTLKYLLWKHKYHNIFVQSQWTADAIVSLEVNSNALTSGAWLYLIINLT